MSILVSRNYINSNYTLRPGGTPDTHTGKTADILWITTNYYVGVNGSQTSNRCPGSDQLFIIDPPIVPYTLHTVAGHAIAKIVLSNSGNYLYFTKVNTSNSTYYVEQYTLTNANFINNKTLYTTYTLPTAGDTIDCFSPDGTYVFITNEYTIKRYTLNTAWDISTLQTGTLQSYNAGSYFYTSSAMSTSFSANGLYVTLSSIYNGQGRLILFLLSSAYNLTSLTYQNVAFIGSYIKIDGFEYNGDGTKMYIMDSFNVANIIEYTVSGNPYRPSSTQTISNSFDYTSQIDTSYLSRDFCLSSDKQYVYIVSNPAGSAGSYTQSVCQFVLFTHLATVVMSDPQIKVAYIDCPNHGTIGSTTLTVRLEVVDQGSSSVTQSGAIWSTSNSTPTFSNYTGSITDGVGGLHVSCSNITGLSNNTFYYIRAWALNGSGYAYSSVYTFTTLNVTTTTTTTAGAGYYNCGYGCQYYSYNPSCSPCTPVNFYIVDVFDCANGCDPIGFSLNIQSDIALTVGRYYFNTNFSNYYYVSVSGGIGNTPVQIHDEPFSTCNHAILAYCL